MKHLTKLSDEELAAYMEGIFSPDFLAKSRDDMDVDTFELLRVALQVRALQHRDIAAPHPWVMHSMAYDAYTDAELPLAGFTGGEQNIETDEP
ncbi:MAG: hypothetical protein E7031_00005 [Akkermansiaceae bacterium]|nr:hypothetical protein [Akkermansiaceae bacterium]